MLMSKNANFLLWVVYLWGGFVVGAWCQRKVPLLVSIVFLSLVLVA